MFAALPPRRALAALGLGLLSLAPAVAPGQEEAGAAAPIDRARASEALSQRVAELVSALGEYRKALDALLAIHETALARAVDRHRGRQALLERGVISRREFEETAAAVSAAERQVAETRAQIDATDHAAAEASTMEAVAALPPLGLGEQQQTTTVSRYRGPTVWSLGPGTASLQQIFATRFGRALPISAFGQTPLHDRLGFDHRNALDVAVYPDSPEGRALIDYLRTEGIPFIAFRGAIPGASSGAHIHIGQPSPKILGGGLRPPSDGRRAPRGALLPASPRKQKRGPSPRSNRNTCPSPTPHTGEATTRADF